MIICILSVGTWPFGRFGRPKWPKKVLATAKSQQNTNTCIVNHLAIWPFGYLAVSHLAVWPWPKWPKKFWSWSNANTGYSILKNA